MPFETEAQDLISKRLLPGSTRLFLDEAVPSEVNVELLGADTLEHVNEFLQTAVVAVDILDVVDALFSLGSREPDML